jgi:hypothetical protein
LHSWWIRTHNKRSFALTGKSDARALTFAELGVLSAAHFNAIAIAFPMVRAPNQYSRSQCRTNAVGSRLDGLRRMCGAPRAVR